jgi:hypothetical protein
MTARHALIAPAGSAYSASYVNKNTSGTFFVANTGSQTIPAALARRVGRRSVSA